MIRDWSLKDSMRLKYCIRHQTSQQSLLHLLK
jgi:hypothetical protein